MAGNQETLIYIENENKTEAEFMSRSFVNSELKNRAYINALGAELVIKYLVTEGIDTSEVHNLHSISKILETLDISDVLLPNIHIDVRVVFNEQQIFVPKSHFEYNVTPDIYVVLKLAKDFTHVEFLGYFEPSKINKNNQNADYYFVDKDLLFSPEQLIQYIKDFNGNTDRGISEEEMLRARQLFISMADHNITEAEQKELIKLMLLSNSLRDSILEFDNFETLSYTVGSQFSDKLVKEVVPVAETFVEEDLSEGGEELTEDNEDSTESEEDLHEDMQDIDFADETEAFVADDVLELDEAENLTETVEEAQSIDVVEESVETQGSAELLEPEVSNDLDIDVSFEDDLVLDEEIQPLDNIEEPVAEEKEEPKAAVEEENVNPLDKIVGDALKKSLETASGAATAGAVAAGAAAAGSAAAEIAGAVTASEEAIKLAGVAGEVVSDIVNKNIEDQNKNLDKIDFDKNAVDATEIPEEVAAYALGDVKHEANLEAEASGQFDTPKDLSELQTVENINSIGYEQIEHETVDLGQMESVELEDFSEDTNELEDLNEITSIDSPTTPIANLDEKLMEQELSEVEHLTDLGFDNSTISINDDGTSSLDNFNFDIGMDNSANDEHLVDFDMSNEIVIDDNMESLNLGNFDETLNVAEDTENLSNIIEKKEEPSFDLPVTEDFDSVEQEFPIEEVIETPVENVAEDIAPVEDVNFAEEEILLAEDDLSFVAQDEEVLPQEDDLTVTEENSVGIEPVMEDVVSGEFVGEDVITEETESQVSDEASIDDFLSELENAAFGDETSEDTALEQPSVAEETVFENVEDDFSELDTIEQTEQAEQTAPQVSDEVQSEEEWLEDTNYDNLQDIEQLQTVEEVQNNDVEEDYISEPEQLQERVFAVTENSRVISDRSFTVGEIPIDINNPQIENYEGSEHLEDLYNADNNVPGAALLQTPGRLGSAGGRGSKVGMGAGLGVIGVILTLVIVGVIGFSVSKMLGNKTEEAPQPITDDALPTSSDNGVSDANTLNIDQNNVVNMDNTQTAPAVPKVQEQPKQQVQQAQPQAKAPEVKTKKAPSALLEVKKLTWEVPDYISYNSNFKQYFQSAGKSLKLSLTSDLLLAKDYPYTDQVRVSVTFNKDGSFKDARTLLSSGSKEIDNIVLQTVNQTLKVLKAPHSVGNDESTTVILKIYF